jgi:hypothetical protein
MNPEQINEAINATPKGANVIVEWERPCYLRAGFKTMPLTKYTNMLCRLGCNYDNIIDTQNGRADGSLPAVNAGLKGRTWVLFPVLLRSIKQPDRIYLRLQSGTFQRETQREYRLDGRKIDVEDYRQYMLAQEFRKSKRDSLTFDVGIQNRHRNSIH